MKHLKKQAMQGLATVSASVLVLSMGVETLANSRAQFINGRLGTTNYQVIQTDSESDGIYYKSEFNSLEEVLNAKKELATQLSAEGSVLLKNDGALPVKKDSENITPPSSVSGKGDSFQFLPPLRTEHATFTAFRSRIYNA